MKLLAGLLGVPAILVLALTPISKGPSAAPPASTPPPPPPTWTTGAAGTLGDVVYPGPGNYAIDLAHEAHYDPVLWVMILDYNTLTIEAGATVRFWNNPTNAPVVIRAIGLIAIDGAINVDGAPGNNYNEPASPATPGPGGFRGGTGRAPTAGTNATAGEGPGGAFGLVNIGWGASGSYATQGIPQSTSSASPGPVYGSVGAIPLLGGSGGGGGLAAGELWSGGGGAGGGAILIGSDTSIRISGSISARGGRNAVDDPFDGRASGAGSGGTIRVVSPLVTWQGGSLDARGGSQWNIPAAIIGGNGRIRVEALAPPTGTPTIVPPGSVVVGLGEFLPTNAPTLTLDSWFDSVAGWIPINQDPRGSISSSGEADVQLPSVGVRLVRIRGHNVTLGATLEVRTTYTRGQAVVDTSHHVGDVPGSTFDASYADVSINFSLGVSTVQVRAGL